MSNELAIQFEDVGKMYKAFESKLDNLLDALNVPNPRGGQRYREFWALRDINLELERGGRLGVIGRNGAGKSTLLKLVTRNLPPTEGRVAVRGNVQALLEIGGGLHPEFTGRENIRSSLGYLGLSRAEIDETEAEIADFTELGRFLDQPFRAYSQGMQMRLSFGIATAVQPEILIADEILGAGDAYFFVRSTERMRRLIEGGATVLLVSHSLEQIVRFCDESIWLDRGRIVMRGNSLEVVKAYEKFTREFHARRILAENKKALSGRFDGFERESYTDTISLEFSSSAGDLGVRGVSLCRDGSSEDTLAVGDAQDAAAGLSAMVVTSPAWSPPQREGETFFRNVGAGRGCVEFQLWFFYPTSDYAIDVSYRAPSGHARVEVKRSDVSLGSFELPACDDWTTHRVVLPRQEEHPDDDSPRLPKREVSRWPGEGSLMIEAVHLLDGKDRECALFNVGEPMSLRMEATATRSDAFQVTPVAVIYRLDGVRVSSHIGPTTELDLSEAERCSFELDFGPLNLGNGRYVFSVALYRTLSQFDGADTYDLIDRSYEFEVVGNDIFDEGIFSHPGTWHAAKLESETEDGTGARGAGVA